MKNIKSSDFTIDDIKSAKKVLFTLFTRYGDTIISLAVIKEFIGKYPEKEYLILCPKQMLPYVNELLPNIKAIAFNKRNIYEFVKITLFLKKEKFDIGFNPWSNGIDSCYLISFCKKFLCYKEFQKPEVINHYDVIRLYLKLQLTDWNSKPLKETTQYQKIVICPQSTDDDRSLSRIELEKLLKKLQERNASSVITIASMDEKSFLSGCKHFKFKKSRQSSLKFIKLLKEASLIICVDSGPLHIATALKKDVIALFHSTNEQLVINSGLTINIEKKMEYVS